MAQLDPELELYRGLMDYPEKFEEGFNIKAVMGALFAGFVIMPGAIYLGLLAGLSLGPAAEWTTIILFTEIARRSYVVLKRQEIYILYYVTGALSGGGAFAILLWYQYFIGSPAARSSGISEQMPRWIVPSPDSPAILQRTFFHKDWLLPGAVIILYTILSRMSWFGMGYMLFRITSDYQRLPFPFAAITAQGTTALAETTTKSETWRWRTFSIGAMIGLAFGFFYVGIPTITGVILTKPLQIFPIPFLELTRQTEGILPAVPTGLDMNLGGVISGFVAPWWSVIGSVVGVAMTMVLNPMLQHHGVLTHWQPGMGTIETSFANNLDFYFSLGIGVSLAVAIIGFYNVGASLKANRKLRKLGQAERGSWKVPEGRGDFPMWLGFGLWFVATLAYVVICRLMVPEFNIWFVVFFGFVLSPIQSYVNAMLIGMIGQTAGIPMVKEATIILSGYRGIKIWFAPIPLSDEGGRASDFRVLELTGTKIHSLIKAELLIWPITIFCSLIFWQFVWKMAPIPSVYYPYVQKMWPLAAYQSVLSLSATLDPDKSQFYQALKPVVIFGGAGFGLLSYTLLTYFKAPVMLVFGVVRGLGSTPHGLPYFLLGGVVSQYYFIPRFGARTWKQYATVLAAGYACGNGLVGMAAVAMALVGKSVSNLPY